MFSIDPASPSLDRCRFFGYPVSAASEGWANLLGVGGDTGINTTGLDAATTWGGAASSRPVLNLGGASPGGTAAYYFYNWERLWPADLSKDITVITRCRQTDSAVNGTVVGTRNSTNNTGGFLLVHFNNGSINGYGAIVYAGGAQFFLNGDGAGAAANLNVTRTVAMVYRSAARQLEIWVDGRLANSAIDTGQDWTPYVTAQPLCIGRAPDGFVFSGQVGWVAVFNRALGSEELLEWAEDGDWPWVDDDVVFSATAPSSATFVTTMTVGSILTPTVGAEAATFVTGVDAEAIVDGDFSIEPEPPAIGTFRTTIGVGSEVYLDTPEFGVFITVVSVGSTLTSTSPVTFVTRVGVRSDARGLIDGRTDLIDTDHYRR